MENKETHPQIIWANVRSPSRVLGVIRTGMCLGSKRAMGRLMLKLPRRGSDGLNLLDARHGIVV
jgi:hypothetical protein